MSDMTKHITVHKSDVNIIKPAVEGAVKALIQLEEVGDVINATNSVVLTLLNYEIDKIDIFIQARKKSLDDVAKERYVTLCSGALTLFGEMAKRLNIPVEDFADLLKKYDFEPHSIYGDTIDAIRFKEENYEIST